MLNISFPEFELDPNEVHIWFVCVDDEKYHLDGLWDILSEDEKERANRFYFDHDRTRYILAHGILRTLLSCYTKTKPNSHYFISNPYGKPALSEKGTPCFNMSHSGSQILYGFTREREIGVDIELVKSIENIDQIIDRYFSKREKLEFSKLPDHLLKEAFYTCWTRKEAFIKAQGQGLSIPLDQFSVSFLTEKPVRILETQHDNQAADRWSLLDVSVNTNYKSAAAVEGHGLIVKTRQWSWEMMRPWE